MRAASAHTLSKQASFGVFLMSEVPLLLCLLRLLQRGAFYRAMGFLTVASPCALVMVPLAYVSAIAAIASRLVGMHWKEQRGVEGE